MRGRVPVSSCRPASASTDCREESMAELRGLRIMVRYACLARAVLLSSVPTTLSAQLSPEATPSTQFTYEQRFDELEGLQAVPNRVAPVTQLVLKRDAGQFTFGEGRFYQLTPIGGRTMGAVFVGNGVFSFAPP